MSVAFAALASVIWITTGPDGTFNSIAARIASGEIYSLKTLNDLSMKTHESCDLAEQRARLIIAVSALETENRQNTLEKDLGRRLALKMRINEVLGCSPGDGFAWLVRAWYLSSGKASVSDVELSLNYSYQMSPNEYWLALRRSFLTVGGEFVGKLETHAGFRRDVRQLASSPDLTPFTILVANLGRTQSLVYFEIIRDLPLPKLVAVRRAFERIQMEDIVPKWLQIIENSRPLTR